MQIPGPYPKIDSWFGIQSNSHKTLMQAQYLDLVKTLYFAVNPLSFLHEPIVFSRGREIHDLPLSPIYLAHFYL